MECREMSIHRMLTFLVVLFLYNINTAYAFSINCNTVFKTNDYQISSKSKCLDYPDNCNYQLSVGAIFTPIYMYFYENDLVCGGYPYGRLRIEGHNHAEGKIKLSILEKIGGNEYVEENENRKIIYQGDVTKRLTEELIIWEGFVYSLDGSERQPIYIKRIRSLPNENVFYTLKSNWVNLPIGSWDKEALSLVGATDFDSDIVTKELHGAYYCGDGGCEPEGIGVLVKKTEVEEFLDRLNKSGLPYTRAELGKDNEDLLYCDVNESYNLISKRLADEIGVEDEEELYSNPELVPMGASHFSSGDSLAQSEIQEDSDRPAARLENEFVCIHVYAVPLREPYVTMALREFPEVYVARRFGGGAGADAISFFLETQTLLSDTNSLNFKNAVEAFGSAMVNYFPNSPNYEISEPVFRNNSLFWNIKGRRTALEKRNNFSDAEAAEWWKVRVQLLIAQKNFGDYILLLGLPETRTINWGLSSFPVDEKFTKELTNDQRFLDFRNRLIGALTKELNGMVFIR